MYGFAGNDGVNKWDYLGENIMEGVMCSFYDVRPRKAFGIDLTTSAVIAGGTTGGFQAVFFSCSCEIGIFAIGPAAQSPDIPNPNLWDIPIGYDVSLSLNASAAISTGAGGNGCDAKSWSGLFYGGTADVSAGAGIGGGLFWDPSGNWIGGSVGVSGALTPGFNIKTNPQFYTLIKTFTLSKCACCALISSIQ